MEQFKYVIRSFQFFEKDKTISFSPLERMVNLNYLGIDPHSGIVHDEKWKKYYTWVENRLIEIPTDKSL